MNRDELLQKHCALLKTITTLPKKIVSLHGSENLSEFILHELCNQECFDLPRAAYFVDNKDFDVLKGVAGFCRLDFGTSCKLDWANPDIFTASMQASPFNQKVRSLSKQSFKNDQKLQEEIAQDIAANLGFKQHAYCSWPLKHDNNGLLLYEKTSNENPFVQDHLADALSLLSFTPIF